MNNRTKFIAGLILLVGYPLLMTFLYGNDELRGKEIYVIPFLTFSITWGAIILIILGLRKKQESMKDMVINRLHLKGKFWEVMSSDRTAGAWVLLFAVATIWFQQAYASWNQVDYWSETWLWFALALGTVMMLLAVVVAKITHSPMNRVLIGATNMKPRDEREQAIMTTAGLYAYATLYCIVFVLFLILISTSRASTLSLLFLLLGLTTFTQGLYKFYCWKLGVRR